MPLTKDSTTKEKLHKPYRDATGFNIGFSLLSVSGGDGEPYSDASKISMNRDPSVTELMNGIYPMVFAHKLRK